MVPHHGGDQQGQLVFKDQGEDQTGILAMIYSSLFIKGHMN
jgi:hypothetical protein